MASFCKPKVKAKRKRVVLSIDDKLNILQLLDESVSYAVITLPFVDMMSSNSAFKCIGSLSAW